MSLFPAVAFSQTWEELPRPTGSSATAFCVNRGVVLFAAVPRQWDHPAPGGIYYSRDFGESWEFFSAEYGDIPFMGRLPNGDLYLNRLETSSRVPPYVYRSTTDGYSWTALNVSARINCIAAKPPDTIFIGTPDVGLYRSTDNGITWLQIGLAANIITIAVAPDGAILAGTNKGLYRSPDNGLTWKHVGADSAFIKLLSVSASGAMVSLTSGTFRRSYDRGLSWSPVEFPAAAVTSAAAEGEQTLVAATPSNEVYLSTDTGHTWRSVTSPDFRVAALGVLPDGRYIFVNSQYGFYRIDLTNGSTVWSLVRTDTLDITAFRLTPRNTLIVSTGPFYRTSLEMRGFYSTDHGARWLPLATNRGMWPWFCDSTGQCIGFEDSVFYTSTDDGVTWETYGAQTMKFSSLARHGNNWYGALSDRIYRSTDSGRSWREIHTPEDSVSFSLYASHKGTLLALVNRRDTHRMYRSTDAGTSWALNDTGPMWHFKRYVETSKGTIICFGSYNANYLRSTDDGVSWTAHRVPRGSSIEDILPHSNGTIFLGNWTTAFSSTDEGVSWREVDMTGAGPNGPLVIWGSVQFQEAPDGRLYMLSFDRKIYRASARLTAAPSIPAPGALPDRYGLLQNYPNPFNPSTTVRCRIPVLSHLTVRIFDILGREVAVLAQGEKPAGEYTLEWNAAGSPTGVYMVRMEAYPSQNGTGEVFHASQKILLLK